MNYRHRPGLLGDPQQYFAHIANQRATGNALQPGGSTLGGSYPFENMLQGQQQRVTSYGMCAAPFSMMLDNGFNNRNYNMPRAQHNMSVGMMAISGRSPAVGTNQHMCNQMSHQSHSRMISYHPQNEVMSGCSQNQMMSCQPRNQMISCSPRNQTMPCNRQNNALSSHTLNQMMPNNYQNQTRSYNPQSQMMFHHSRNQTVSCHHQNLPESLNCNNSCTQQIPRNNIKPLMSQDNLMTSSKCQRRVNICQTEKQRQNTRNIQGTVQNNQFFPSQTRSTHQHNSESTQNGNRTLSYPNISPSPTHRISKRLSKCESFYSKSRQQFQGIHSSKASDNFHSREGHSVKSHDSQSKANTNNSKNSVSIATEEVHVERVVTCRRQVTRSRLQDSDWHHWSNGDKQCDQQTVTLQTRETILRQTPVHTVFEYNHNSPVYNALNQSEASGLHGETIPDSNNADTHNVKTETESGTLKPERSSSPVRCVVKEQVNKEGEIKDKDSLAKPQVLVRDYNHRSYSLDSTENSNRRETVMTENKGLFYRDSSKAKECQEAVKVKKQEECLDRKVYGKSFVRGAEMRHRRSPWDKHTQRQRRMTNSNHVSTSMARKHTCQSLGETYTTKSSVSPTKLSCMETWCDETSRLIDDSFSVKTSVGEKKESSISSVNKPIETLRSILKSSQENTISSDHDCLTKGKTLKVSSGGNSKDVEGSVLPQALGGTTEKSLGKTWHKMKDGCGELVLNACKESTKILSKVMKMPAKTSATVKNQITNMTSSVAPSTPNNRELAEKKLESLNSTYKGLSSGLVQDTSVLAKARMFDKQDQLANRVTYTSDMSNSSLTSKESSPVSFVQVDSSSTLNQQNPPKFWSPDYRFMSNQSNIVNIPTNVDKTSKEDSKLQQHFLPRSVRLNQMSLKPTTKPLLNKKSVFNDGSDKSVIKTKLVISDQTALSKPSRLLDSVPEIKLTLAKPPSSANNGTIAVTTFLMSDSVSQPHDDIDPSVPKPQQVLIGSGSGLCGASEKAPIRLQSRGSISYQSGTSDSLPESVKSPDHSLGLQDHHSKSDGNLTITIIRGMKLRERRSTSTTAGESGKAASGETKSIMSPVSRRTNVRTCILSGRKPAIKSVSVQKPRAKVVSTRQTKSVESSPVDHKLLKDVRVQVEDLNLSRLTRTRVPRICLGDRFALQKRTSVFLSKSSEPRQKVIKSSQARSSSSCSQNRQQNRSSGTDKCSESNCFDNVNENKTASEPTAAYSAEMTESSPSLLNESEEPSLDSSSSSCCYSDQIVKRKPGRPPATKTIVSQPDVLESSSRSSFTSTDFVVKLKPGRKIKTSISESHVKDSSSVLSRTSNDQIVKRKRGRPLGSKTKKVVTGIKVSLNSSSVSNTMSTTEQIVKRKPGRPPGSKTVKHTTSTKCLTRSSQIYHCSQIQSVQMSKVEKQQESTADLKVTETVRSVSISSSSVTHKHTSESKFKLPVFTVSKNSKSTVPPLKISVPKTSGKASPQCKVTPLRIPLSRLTNKCIARTKMQSCEDGFERTTKSDSVPTLKMILIKKGLVKPVAKDEEIDPVQHKQVVTPLKISGSVVTKKTVEPLRLSLASPSIKHQLSKPDMSTSDTDIKSSEKTLRIDKMWESKEKVSVRRLVPYISDSSDESCSHSDTDLNTSISSRGLKTNKSTVLMKSDSPEKCCEEDTERRLAHKPGEGFKEKRVTVNDSDKKLNYRKVMSRKRKSSGSSSDDQSGSSVSALPECQVDDATILKKTRVSDEDLLRSHDEKSMVSCPDDEHYFIHDDGVTEADFEIDLHEGPAERNTLDELTSPSTTGKKLPSEKEKSKYGLEKSESRHRKGRESAQGEQKQSKHGKSHSKKKSQLCDERLPKRRENEIHLHRKIHSSKSRDWSKNEKHRYSHRKRSSSEELEIGKGKVNGKRLKCTETREHSSCNLKETNRNHQKGIHKNRTADKKSSMNIKQNIRNFNKLGKQLPSDAALKSKSIRKKINSTETKNFQANSKDGTRTTRITFNMIQGDQLSQPHLRLRTCLYCRSFSTRLDQIMKEHLKVAHPFKCRICHIAFKDQLETKAHRLTRHLQAVHHCMLCHQVFLSEHNYRRHVKSKNHLSLVKAQKEAIDAICGVFFQHSPDSQDSFAVALRRIQDQDGLLWNKGKGKGKKALPALGGGAVIPQPPNLSHLRHFYYDNPELEKSVQKFQDFVTAHKFALGSAQTQTLSVTDAQEEMFFFPLPQVEDTENWTVTSESETEISTQMTRVENRDILEMSLSEVLGAAMSEWENPVHPTSTLGTSSNLKYSNEACVVVHDGSGMNSDVETIDKQAQPFENIISNGTHLQRPDRLTSFTESSVTDSTAESSLFSDTDDSFGSGSQLLPLISSCSIPCASNSEQPNNCVKYSDNQEYQFPLTVPLCIATDVTENDDLCSDNEDQDTGSLSDFPKPLSLPSSIPQAQPSTQSEASDTLQPPKPLTLPSSKSESSNMNNYQLPKPLTVPSSETKEISRSPLTPKPLTLPSSEPEPCMNDCQVPKPLTLPSSEAESKEVYSLSPLNSSSTWSEASEVNSSSQPSELLPVPMSESKTLCQVSSDQLQNQPTLSSSESDISSQDRRHLSLPSSQSDVFGEDSSSQTPTSLTFPSSGTIPFCDVSSSKIPKPLTMPSSVPEPVQVSCTRSVHNPLSTPSLTNQSDQVFTQQCSSAPDTGSSEESASTNMCSDNPDTIKKTRTFCSRDLALCQPSLEGCRTQPDDLEKGKVNVVCEIDMMIHSVSDVSEECRLKAEINQILREIAEDEKINEGELLTGRPS